MKHKSWAARQRIGTRLAIVASVQLELGGNDRGRKSPMGPQSELLRANVCLCARLQAERDVEEWEARVLEELRVQGKVLAVRPDFLEQQFRAWINRHRAQWAGQVFSRIIADLN